MKTPAQLSQMFDSIRQLPLEVSFQQVEQWIQNQPLSSKQPKLSIWQKFINLLKL